MGIIKFSIKCALAGGAAYYLTEQGVWKSSVHTEQLYGKINTNLKPYVKEVTSQLPFQIPDLPNSNRMSYLMNQCWNHGVMSTFAFLRDLPERVSMYTQHGVDMAMSNEGMQQFFGSLGGGSVEEKKDTK